MTPDECRLRAALCQSKADTANDSRARLRYLELVEQWSLLAADTVARRADKSFQDTEAIRYRDALKRKALMDRIRVQHERFTSSEMLLRNRNSAPVVSRARLVGAWAPSTVKLAPGRVWNVALACRALPVSRLRSRCARRERRLVQGGR